MPVGNEDIILDYCKHVLGFVCLPNYDDSFNQFYFLFSIIIISCIFSFYCIYIYIFIININCIFYLSTAIMLFDM